MSAIAKVMPEDWNKYINYTEKVEQEYEEKDGITEDIFDPMLISLGSSGSYDATVFEYSVSSSSDRRAYVWGVAEHGALGIHHKVKQKGRHPPQYYQRPSCHAFSFIHKIVDVTCGYGFTVYAVENNDQYKVFGCGINTDSQIGYHAPRKGHSLGLVLAPAPVELPLKSDETKIKKVSAGRSHTVALSNNEGAFIFGNNSYGQCGRPVIEEENYGGSRVINNIPNLSGESIVDICCGQDHTLFLSENGKVWSCGWGADGQTGLSHYNNEWNPSLIKGDIEHERITKLSTCGDCVLALNDKGNVFGWGNSEYKQLLSSCDLMQCNSPVRLLELDSVGPIRDVAAGGSLCIAVNEEGKVFVWGYGYIGVGPDVFSSKKLIEIPSTLFGCNQFDSDVKVVKVAAGLYHLAVITNRGHLYMWGHNKGGCLGLGHTKDQFFPMKVAVGAHVIKVALGVDHTVALCKPFS